MSTKPVSKRWWTNWPQTFGYVPPRTYFPETVDEISTIVQVDPGPLKAVGGGWSFNEASLPMAKVPDAERRCR